MYKPESVLENETQKILCDFDKKITKFRSEDQT